MIYEFNDWYMEYLYRNCHLGVKRIWKQQKVGYMFLKQLIYVVCCVLILDVLVYDMDVGYVIRCSDIWVGYM